MKIIKACTVLLLILSMQSAFAENGQPPVPSVNNGPPPVPAVEKKSAKEQVKICTIAPTIKISPIATKTVKTVNYSDLDLTRIAKDAKYELDDEKNSDLADLRVLWQAAVTNSETIRFAILKLSNPDGEQPSESVVKKILTPLTSVAPMIGMSSGDKLTGGSTMIGSGILNSLLSDDSLINNRLSKVTDTDLILLAQEIDTLQQKLVGLYYDYLDAQERLYFVNKLVENRYKYYQSSQNSSSDILSVADVFYRESLDIQYKTRQEVLTARANLEQFVGNNAVDEVDKKIKIRLASS